VKRVQQEDAWGCGIAVLAMLTGQTYPAVRAEFTKRHIERGLIEFDINAYLAEHGYAVAVKYPHYAPQQKPRDVWPPAPFADVHYCAVHTVAATNHYVVWLADGGVLDPATAEARRLTDYREMLHVAGVVRIARAAGGEG